MDFAVSDCWCLRFFEKRKEKKRLLVPGLLDLPALAPLGCRRRPGGVCSAARRASLVCGAGIRAGPLPGPHGDHAAGLVPMCQTRDKMGIRLMPMALGYSSGSTCSTNRLFVYLSRGFLKNYCRFFFLKI